MFGVGGAWALGWGAWAPGRPRPSAAGGRTSHGTPPLSGRGVTPHGRISNIARRGLAVPGGVCRLTFAPGARPPVFVNGDSAPHPSDAQRQRKAGPGGGAAVWSDQPDAAERAGGARCDDRALGLPGIPDQGPPARLCGGTLRQDHGIRPNSRGPVCRAGHDAQPRHGGLVGGPDRYQAPTCSMSARPAGAARFTPSGSTSAAHQSAAGTGACRSRRSPGLFAISPPQPSCPNSAGPSRRRTTRRPSACR